MSEPMRTMRRYINHALGKQIIHSVVITVNRYGLALWQDGQRC